VISGKVKLDTAGKSFDVSEEDLLVLHPNITYKIVALRKSVFLMTVVE
jgi:quercetin dioxygenase-like cupin family protein